MSHPNFRRFYAGYTTSLFGTGMAPVGVAFAVLASGGSAADLGFVLTAGVAANVSCLMAGGVVADRIGRRVVMLGSDAVRCVAEGAFAALVLLGHPALWSLIVLYAVQNAATGFFTPALLGLTPEIVAKEELHDANVLTGLSRDIGRVAGPAVAGLIVAVSGPGMVIAADAGTFAFSVVSLALLRLPPYQRTSSRSMFGDLRDGWHAWRSRSWIWVTSIKFAIFNAVVYAPFIVLGPAIAKQDLGGAGTWGLILAAQGAGSVATAPLILRRQPSRPLVAVTVVQAAWAFPLACLALRLPALVIAAAAFLAGMGSATFNVIWTTTLQRNVPAALMARVNSFDYFCSYALAPIGLALAGPVSGLVGVSAVLWAGVAWQAVSTAGVLALPMVYRFRDPATGTATGGDRSRGEPLAGRGNPPGEDGKARFALPRH